MSLRRSIAGEYNLVKVYFERETNRRDYVKKRWDFREEEKRELDRQAAIKAGVCFMLIVISSPRCVIISHIVIYI
jgi:hypothetical protein